MIKKCVKCGQEKEHQAKGMCYYCYKKFSWKPKTGLCKRCHRDLPLHSKGMCGGCYNFVFHLESSKAWNYKKWYGLDPETYKKITEKCVICGFDKIVDLHHLDSNRNNDSEKNMIGLCPNHHKMIHMIEFRDEVLQQLNKQVRTT